MRHPLSLTSTTQSTLAVEKEVSERSFLFIEYVGNFAANGAASQLLNSGGGYRITDRQQVDFHVGVGLDRNAPDYIVGIGYSFRLDGLFAGLWNWSEFGALAPGINPGRLSDRNIF